MIELTAGCRSRVCTCQVCTCQAGTCPRACTCQSRDSDSRACGSGCQGLIRASTRIHRRACNSGSDLHSGRYIARLRGGYLRGRRVGVTVGRRWCSQNTSRCRNQDHTRSRRGEACGLMLVLVSMTGGSSSGPGSASWSWGIQTRAIGSISIGPSRRS